MKKIINYSQLTVASLVVVVSLTLLSGFLFKEVANMTGKIITGIIVVLNTMGIVVVIREVKYFYRPNINDNDQWTVGGSLVCAFLYFFVNFVYYQDIYFANGSLILLAIMVVATSFFHRRYGVIVSISAAALLALAPVFQNDCQPVEEYFFQLGTLLGLVLIVEVIKLLFFTKWSDHFKEKEKTEKESGSTK